MKTKMYTPLEEVREIPSVREAWRRCFLQLTALDSDILRCLRKLSKPGKQLGKPVGLVSSIGNPYSANIDQRRLDMILPQYKSSFVNFDYLYSRNEGEFESEKLHVKDFLFNYSLASRLWLDRSEVKSEVIQGTRNYRVTISISPPAGQETMFKKDPSYIEIVVEDDGLPGKVVEDDIVLEKELKAYLNVKYQGDEFDKDSLEESAARSKRSYPIYIKKGTKSRIDAVEGNPLYVREIYLSEDARMNGDVVQAYLLYRINLLLRHCISYPMLYTDVFHGLLYTRSGEGYAQVSEEKISAQVEEVMGEAPQHEIKNIFIQLLRSIGNTVDDVAVISALFPAQPVESLDPEVQEIIRDMREHPPDAEQVMNNAGLLVTRNRLVDVIGSQVSTGLPVVSGLIVDIMSTLLSSQSSAAIMIDELDTAIKTIKDQFSIDRSTPDQQRFFPKASKLILTVLERAELLEFVEEAGIQAIHSLRENPTSENLLNVFSSLQFSKLAESMKKQNKSLNYSDVYWDNGFREGVLDRHWIIQWSRSDGNSLTEYYAYCLKRTGNVPQTGEGEVDGAVFTGSLLGEDTSPSNVPLLSELHQYEREQQREIERLKHPGTLAEFIESVVGVET